MAKGGPRIGSRCVPNIYDKVACAGGRSRTAVERSLHRVIAARSNRATRSRADSMCETSSGRAAHVTLFALWKARLIGGGRLIAPEPAIDDGSSRMSDR